MKGNTICLEAEADRRGKTFYGYVSGTPKPGTVMELKRGVATVGGRHTWEPAGTTAASGYNGMANDGDRIEIVILLDDLDQGRTYDDAYVSGELAPLYSPAIGDEFNMILENQSGTGDVFSLGDKLMVDNGTGKLLAVDSDAEAEPFVLMEDVAALTADAHAWVRFTGV